MNYSTSPRVHLSCIHFALFLFCSVPLAGFELAIFLPVAPECRVTSRWTPSFLFFCCCYSFVMHGIRGGQRTICGHQFSPSSIRVQQVKLRLSSLWQAPLTSESPCRAPILFLNGNYFKMGIISEYNGGGCLHLPLSNDLCANGHSFNTKKKYHNMENYLPLLMWSLVQRLTYWFYQIIGKEKQDDDSNKTWDPTGPCVLVLFPASG